MPTHLHENKINNSQDNISPLERDPTIPGPEYCNISETKEIDFKIAFMTMIQVLKQGLNESLKTMKTKISSVKIK